MPTPPFEITCVIFAGGKSSRMGENKALLPFGNAKTLLQYQYERLKKLFAAVYISSKCPHPFELNAPFICDPKSTQTFAPTAGFVALFEQLSEERVFVISVDTPFVSQAQIAALIEADQDKDSACIARTPEGTHPMCGIYHRSLKTHFEQMLKNNDHRLGKLLKHTATHWVTFENEEAFMNLNHPHDYQRALEHLKESDPKDRASL